MVRVIIAAVVGAVLFSVLEALTYGTLIPDLVDATRISYDGLIKEQPDLIPFLLFNLVWASLLAGVFEYLAHIRSFLRGAVAGCIIMSAVVLGINLGYIAFFNLLENIFVIVPVKIAAMAVTGAVVGGVIAKILGWGDQIRSHS
ncbi:MAG TPA: hypothetical protein VMM38_16220 [Aridibacter sp.]|nr:hypothetical protein [Aridibacter sp.]